MEKLEKVVFIDRDGVINYDSPEYIKSPSELIFIENSMEALRILNKAGFELIIITNQSVINRKLVSLKGLNAIFDKIRNEAKKHFALIKDIFYCPHIPEDNCDCRKPKPGLFYKAQEKYEFDFNKAYMIGDSSKDIIAAQKYGIKNNILVQTGNGLKSLKEIQEKNIPVSFIAKDLYDASLFITKKM